MCYLYTIYREEGGYDNVFGGYYLCVLEQPYEQWTCYTFDFSSINEYSALSCRRDVTETVLEAYQEGESKKEQDFASLGISRSKIPLNEEQIAQLWVLRRMRRRSWTTGCSCIWMKISNSVLRQVGRCNEENEGDAR